MKALVTGAAGFIGSHLATALVGSGYEVTCIARDTTNRRWIEHLDLRFITCDLYDVESLACEIQDFEYVFHVAGLTKAASEGEFFRANVECTQKLLRVVADGNVRLKRFIYVSSLAAAGPSLDGCPVCEDLPPSPVSLYGRSKLEGERAVLSYTDRMPVTVVRPPAVYGPRDADLFVMFRMLQKGLFPYWGNSRYSMIYVDDLVRGIMLAAEKKEAEGKTFFLCGGSSSTNEEIAAAICAALGREAMKVPLPRSLLSVAAFAGEKIMKKGIINRDKMRELRFSDWTCDGSRARNELGFHPEITLREGIQWTADWYRIHRWL